MTGAREVIEVRNGAGQLVVKRGPFPKGSPEADRAYGLETHCADITNRSSPAGDWRRVLVYRVIFPTPSASEPKL